MRRVGVLLAVALVLGCGGEGDADGGLDAAARDSGTDAGPVLCARRADCDDGVYCNGEEMCAPGDPGAGPDGCMAGVAPCADGCDEVLDTCTSCDEPDADDDGHDARACGGDDCDDNDPLRYPGNEEMCDPGHDEDCDDSTLGGTDADGDGYVSAACCNGERCGDDCADDDGNINPGAGERCDGADNNCSGAADDAALLCPGGTCALGRCDFVGWDRTFGSEEDDFAGGVAIDGEGNIYISGVVGGDSDFGEGPRVVVGSGDFSPFVVSYAPDRTKRWVWASPLVRGSHEPPPRIAVGHGVVAITVSVDESGDIGGTTVAGDSVVLLDADDGTVQSVMGGPSSLRLAAIATAGDGFVVAGELRPGDAFSLGGTTLEVSTRAPIIWAFSPAGEYRNHRLFEPVGPTAAGAASAVSASGDRIALSGWYRGELSVGGRTVSGQGLWAARLDATLETADWLVDLDEGTALLTGERIALGEDVVAVATTVREATRILGRDFSPTAGDTTAVVVWLSADEGVLVEMESFGSAIATSVQVGADGSTHVAGSFGAATNFGGGLLEPVGGRTSGYYVIFDAEQRYRSEATYGSDGFAQTHAIGIGPAGSRVLVGDFGVRIALSVPRLSVGRGDIFVQRLD